jgi:hypothetical protein
MALRHAAVLAQLGWCLALQASPSIPSPRASPWSVVTKFHTLAECQSVREKIEGIGIRHSLDRPPDYESLRQMKAVCIRSDDPSLTLKYVIPYFKGHQQSAK